MHAAMRRMPAEQARHAKRLGHVQAGVLGDPSSGSSTAAAATTQQSVTPASASTAVSTSHTSASATSTTQSSESSAPPSSSTILSYSSSPSPAISSTPATDTPPFTTNAASPTTSITIPPLSSATPQVRAAAGGLSPGAVAGIIAGGAIVGVALIVFFVRKTYLRRRERKRISWTRAPGLGTGSLGEPKYLDTNERSTLSTAETTSRSAPISPFEPRGQSRHSAPVSPGAAPTSFPTYSVPTPLSATYNNPPAVAYPTLPAPPAPSTYGLAMPRASSGVGAYSMHPHHAPMPAAVLCSFVPSLPDELSITTGERVFVVEQYDDGWNLCANGRGERGMVPRECLDATPPDQPDVGWRNGKRMSSLSSDGRRY